MRDRSSTHTRGEAGYNLVILMVAVTVLNILVAASLPLWSQAIKRDKEEELIFRGLQYAEAIRLFRARFQRPPVRLEELIEVKPRCIRHLWTDPMTEDGKWKVIFEGEGTPLQPPTGALTPQEPKDEIGPDAPPEDEGGFDPGRKKELTVGPIAGVRSRSTDTSALLWFGQNRYDQWEFRWDRLPGSGGGQQQQSGIGGQPQAFAVPNPSAAPIESIRWWGRPWRSFLPQGGGPPLGQPPGDPGVKPGRRGGQPGGAQPGRGASTPGES